MTESDAVFLRSKTIDGDGQMSPPLLPMRRLEEVLHMTDEWAKIQSDYDKAKAALWCPEDTDYWHREEETGRYHMWRAYHQASAATEKDSLLFARILSMMADENRTVYSDYERYHKFVRPAVEAYDKAIEAGQHPTDKELKQIRFSAESLAYVLECEELPCEEQVKRIRGFERLADFEFHDSKPTWFEYSGQTVKLKLEFYETSATFLFEGVKEIVVNNDPVADWVMDFCCYPCFYNKDLLIFDIGSHRITCAKISVEAVEKIDAQTASIL